MKDRDRIKSRGERVRVCALVPYPANTTPSQRYRLEQWLPALESQGISIDLMPFADEELMSFLHKPGRQAAKAVSCLAAFARRLKAVAAAKRYDVVLIHRAACLLGPAWLERIIAILGRPVVFDFDDAIYLLDTTEANRRFGWLKFPGKTATLCRISRHVVVGNSYLAGYARQFNSRLTVIPSSVDTERYRPQKDKAQKKSGSPARVVIGWTGSSTSQTHLEMFAPALGKVLARGDVELRVHSDREPRLGDLPYVWRPWSAETELEELSRFDIGIMPMPDNPWAYGKCSMKALLYMSLAIPAVCSAVGNNREVIEHGQNGLLAATAEDWTAHLNALIDDPLLRERLGEAGRRTIEERYSKHYCASLFGGVIREAAA